MRKGAIWVLVLSVLASSPLFALANGGGFDTMVADTLSLIPKAGVTLNTYPDYGHQDIVFATNQFNNLEQPLLQ